MPVCVDRNLIYNHKTFDKLINKIRVTYETIQQKKIPSIHFSERELNDKMWLQCECLELESVLSIHRKKSITLAEAKMKSNSNFKWTFLNIHQMQHIDLPVSFVLILKRRCSILSTVRTECRYIIRFNFRVILSFVTLKKINVTSKTRRPKLRSNSQVDGGWQQKAKSNRKKYSPYTNSEHRHRTALCLPRFLSIMLYRFVLSSPFDNKSSAFQILVVFISTLYPLLPFIYLFAFMLWINLTLCSAYKIKWLSKSMWTWWLSTIYIDFKLKTTLDSFALLLVFSLQRSKFTRWQRRNIFFSFWKRRRSQKKRYEQWQRCDIFTWAKLKQRITSEIPMLTLSY